MLTKEQLIELRRLRLWHFRQMKQAQVVQEKRKADGDKKAAAYWERQVVFHGSSVDAINPLFEVGDAASSDDLAPVGE